MTLSKVVFLNFIFYGSIVDLKCANFRCTAKQFSYTHTHTHICIWFFFIIGYYNVLNIVPCIFTVFPGDPMVKNTPAKQEPQEMQVRSLIQEDPLEEGMATHSSILAWRIP